MKPKLSQITSFIFILSFSIFHYSCNPEGCTEITASNFDIEAKEDDGSCDFSGRTISFYTKSNIGGELYIELSESDIDNGGYNNDGPKEELSPFLTNKLSFDEIDINYPRCGFSNLLLFKRYTSSNYVYNAVDLIGNTWTGSVSAKAGECKLVEIPRDSSDFGRLIFYVEKRLYSNHYFHARLKSEWEKGQKIAPKYSFSEKKLFLNNELRCNDSCLHGILVKSGKITFYIDYYGREKEITIDVMPNECNFVDVSSIVTL